MQQSLMKQKHSVLQRKFIISKPSYTYDVKTVNEQNGYPRGINIQISHRVFLGNRHQSSSLKTKCSLRTVYWLH